MSINRRAAARFALACLVAVGIVAFVRPRQVTTARGQDLKKFNQFVQTSNSPSMKALREGRDLIDGEQWAKAAEKFAQFVSSYPKDRDVDVALYWLAYALKQQGKFREAADRLTRLLQEFPQSKWAEDATAMLTEIAPQTGDRRVIDDSLNKNNEEIKIVALQSLFESNPERAMAYVADILKPNSTATRSFKEAAVALLSHGGRQAAPLLLDIARTQPDRELRVVAIRRLADALGDGAVEDLIKLYDSERDVEVKAHILRSFEGVRSPRSRAKLIEVARNASENAELRAQAIRTLGDSEDAGAFDELIRLFAADSNREVKEQIIRTLADMQDPRARAALLELARGGGDADLRGQAIRRLGDIEGESVVDELMKIYDAERDPEVKRHVLHALADTESQRARERITQIARGEGDRDLKRTAIRILADREGAGAADMLAAMYDAERDAEIKSDILRALADTKTKAALRKLLDVARRDPNIELRKRAVQLLGESDDPEAARFLEELLKP